MPCRPRSQLDLGKLRYKTVELSSLASYTRDTSDTAPAVIRHRTPRREHPTVPFLTHWSIATTTHCVWCTPIQHAQASNNSLLSTSHNLTRAAVLDLEIVQHAYVFSCLNCTVVILPCPCKTAFQYARVSYLLDNHIAFGQSWQPSTNLE